MTRFRVGQRVKFRVDDEWVSGVVADVFTGPASGLTVYDIGGHGFYEHEIRESLTGAEKRLLAAVYRESFPSVAAVYRESFPSVAAVYRESFPSVAAVERERHP